MFRDKLSDRASSIGYLNESRVQEFGDQGMASRVGV